MSGWKKKKKKKAERIDSGWGEGGGGSQGPTAGHDDRNKCGSEVRGDGGRG